MVFGVTYSGSKVEIWLLAPHPFVNDEHSPSDECSCIMNTCMMIRHHECGSVFHSLELTLRPTEGRTIIMHYRSGVRE